MRFVLAATLLGAHACGSACPAARVRVADGEPISGATVNALSALLDDVALGPVPLVWEVDGTLTDVHAALSIDPGSGRLSQRAECVPGCVVLRRRLLPCGDDELSVQATGTIDTADGRVRDQTWSGDLLASRSGDTIGWSVSASIPLDAVNEPDVVQDSVALRATDRDVALRVHLTGRDATLDTASFDVAFDRPSTGAGISALIGASPDDELDP